VDRKLINTKFDAFEVRFLAAPIQKHRNRCCLFCLQTSSEYSQNEKLLDEHVWLGHASVRRLYQAIGFCEAVVLKEPEEEKGFLEASFHLGHGQTREFEYAILDKDPVHRNQ
jgi:hypothetical protein